MLGGALFLIVGAIFYTKQQDFFPELEDYSYDMGSAMIAMMAIGGVLFLFGFVGCLGACSGKSGLLNIYFIVVLICVILEIVVIILSIVKRDDFEDAAEKAAQDLFTKYADRWMKGNTAIEISDDENNAVNYAQSTFECCGLSKTDMWEGKVPPGCCSGFSQDEWQKDANRQYALDACPADTTKYTTDCVTQVHNLADEYGVVIIVIVCVIIGFELICLIAACVSKKKKYVA